MAVLSELRIVPGPRRSRHALLKVAAVGCALAVLVAVAFETDGFGLAGLIGSGGSSSGPPGPNPNPYNEEITNVTGKLTYTGSASGYLHGLAGFRLCGPCPILPAENASFSPPVAGLWVYFNVTNVGTTYTDIANFTLNTTTGGNATLFVLFAVVCCYPHYEEDTSEIGFVPSQTQGIGIYLEAQSVPDDGPTGYALSFLATSP